MSRKHTKWLVVALGLVVAVLAAVVATTTEQTEAIAEPIPLDQIEGPRINAQEEKIAIKGYDPVAYFVEGRPVQGSPEFDYVWQDARWHFASQENRDLFASRPERYSPQYGGFCALGVAYGLGADIDPEAWSIVDGRLYLNYDMAARDEFRENLAANIAQADGVWSKLTAN